MLTLRTLLKTDILKINICEIFQIHPKLTKTSLKELVDIYNFLSIFI